MKFLTIVPSNWHHLFFTWSSFLAALLASSPPFSSASIFASSFCPIHEKSPKWQHAQSAGLELSHAFAGRYGAATACFFTYLCMTSLAPKKPVVCCV